MKKVSKIALFSYHSLRVLVRPQDTLSLIKLGNVISDSKAFKYNLTQLKKDKSALNLIKKRYSVGIPDLDELKKYPENTFGAKLLKHFKACNIKPYPFPIKKSYTEIEYIRERQREIHDTVHTLLGVGVDLTSEASVNAFITAQNGAPVAALIVGGSIIRVALLEPQNLLNHIDKIARHFLMGRRSRNIFGVKWEELFDWDFEKVERFIFIKRQKGFVSKLKLEFV